MAQKVRRRFLTTKSVYSTSSGSIVASVASLQKQQPIIFSLSLKFPPPALFGLVPSLSWQNLRVLFTQHGSTQKDVCVSVPLLLDQAHEPELPALVLDDQRALAVRELLVVRLADDVRQQPREVAFADQLFLWWWWQATKCKQRASLAAARERRRWARPSRFYPAG